MPLGAPLVGQTVFVIKKWAPGAPKVCSRIGNELKMKPKRSPSAKMNSKSGPFSEPGENELRKWTRFGSRPGGVRETLTIKAKPTSYTTQGIGN